MNSSIKYFSFGILLLLFPIIVRGRSKMGCDPYAKYPSIYMLFWFHLFRKERQMALLPAQKNNTGSNKTRLCVHSRTSEANDRTLGIGVDSHVYRHAT